MTRSQRAGKLNDEDHARLSRLEVALRQPIHLAKTRDDLIALGEALDAIERVLQEEAIEVNVGLSVGFRRGDEDV